MTNTFYVELGGLLNCKVVAKNILQLFRLQIEIAFIFMFPFSVHDIENQKKGKKKSEGCVVIHVF